MFEEWILIHKVVEVGYLPGHGALVLSWHDLEEVSPSQVAFKAHNVLDILLVSATEENFGVVLVLHVQLHGRLNKSSHSHNVGTMVCFHPVEDSLVSGLVILGGGTFDARLCHGVLIQWFVFCTLKAKAVRDLNFENLDILSNSEVGHFDVEAVEVDTVETLFDCRCKLSFTYVINSCVIVQSAALVENSIQLVELQLSSCILDEHLPIAFILFVLSFKFVDDFWEVPREGQHVCVLLLRKL